MIANAGIGKVLSLVDMTVEVWDRIMCVNARSTMLAYKHAVRQMIKQGRGGRIIGQALLYQTKYKYSLLLANLQGRLPLPGNRVIYYS